LPHGALNFLADGHNYDLVDSALLIDATMKGKFPPISLPGREYMERALDIWQEINLPPLQLKNPWYGYSLGLWSVESDEEARLATKGEYYETGQKLINRRVADLQGNSLAEIRRMFRSSGPHE
jgi:hypothetical protein